MKRGLYIVIGASPFGSKGKCAHGLYATMVVREQLKETRSFMTAWVH